LTKSNKILKRIFDFVLSFVGVIIFFWLIIILALIAMFNTKSFGFYTQKRVGYQGKIFWIYKIRTMKSNKSILTTVTTAHDKRITIYGKFLRKYKLDELPQLINVLFGNMSFVGPRPDVPGFADQLQGEDKVILSIKPGITGPASIFFRNEEVLLGNQGNPEKYNLEVIWPKKVLINRRYIKEYSFGKDLYYIVQTLLKL